MNKEYPVKLELRIDWSELDVFGHVNNVTFFKYMQAARLAYWAATGIAGFKDEKGVAPVLASASCQFRQPLFFPGNIVIESRTVFMKTTSFGLEHRILNDKGEVVAEAEDVMVMFDFTSNQKTEIPTEMRRRTEEIEGRKFGVESGRL